MTDTGSVHEPRFNSVALGALISLGMIIPIGWLTIYLGSVFDTPAMLFLLPLAAYVCAGVAFTVAGRARTAKGIAVGGFVLYIIWVAFIIAVALVIGMVSES